MASVYEIVTSNIIDRLKENVIPWQQPWTNKVGPINLKSGRPYSGINVLLLTSTNFTAPYWLSYKQAVEMGGNVRKGEKSTMVVYWKVGTMPSKTEKDDKGNPLMKKSFILRYYNIFNVEQIDGIEDKIPKDSGSSITDSVVRAKNIAKNYPRGPRIAHGGELAFYSPGIDRITMPYMKSFPKAEEYYSTLFHEMVHSTGHESRLNREIKNVFGDEKYSKEELVAEIGASFLCNISGIAQNVPDNSVAYIQVWISKLQEDSRLIVHAAAHAQRATNHILGKDLEEALVSEEIMEMA